MRIDIETESRLRAAIGEVVAPVAKSLRSEIQSDGFLLIHFVPTETATAEEIEDALLRARKIIRPAIPPRVGTHSWMILVSKSWALAPLTTRFSLKYCPVRSMGIQIRTPPTY